MPSFAPSTAARSQPIRCVRCCSKLPAAMLEAFLIWELFNATKRDMVEAPCFDDTRNPTPVMLYLGAFNSIALEGLERGGLLARSFSGCSPGSAGGSRAFLPLAVSFAAPVGFAAVRRRVPILLGLPHPVQELLLAKRDLRLSKEIKKLAKHDGLIIDEMGYVQQSREEMEVLFTLLAERYERGSVLLTSNLPFSKWEGIFKDPMTTAAAIDRLVHHCVILELNIPSYRMEQAKKNRDTAPDSGEAN